MFKKNIFTELKLLTDCQFFHREKFELVPAWLWFGQQLLSGLLLTEQQIVPGAKHQGGRGELTRACSDETARAHELASRSLQSCVHRVTVQTVFVVCMFEVLTVL